MFLRVNHAEEDAYLLQDFDLRLRLCSTIGVVTPSVNEGLQMLPVVHLSLVLLLEVPVALRLGRVELREVSDG